MVGSMRNTGRALIAGIAGLACAVSSRAGEAREPVIGILGALVEEVQLLGAQLDDGEVRTVEGIEFAVGRLRGRRVAIALTGVGKVHAALTAALLIVNFRPTEVLFTGVAGALNPDLRPGDVVIADKTVYHDLGTLSAEGFRRHGARNPFTRERNPVFYPADPRLLKLALAAKERVKLHTVTAGEGERAPRVVTGVVATGDTFIALAAKRKELRTELNADVVEMEGAAVAQVCWHWRIPCLVIRSVSDSADEKARVDIRAFRDVAAHNSAALVEDILEHLGAPEEKKQAGSSP